MRFSRSRYIVNVLLFTVAVLQIGVLLFRELVGEAVSVIVPAMSLLTALGLLFLWGQWRRDTRRTRRIFTQSEQLRQEVKALNKHALVSLTDVNCEFVYVNEALLEATGYTEAELLGKPLEFLYFPDDLAQVSEQRATAARGDTWQGESRVRCKDGSKLWTNLTFMPGVTSNGRICGSISVRTDISDVKRLQADKEVFQALSSVPDEIFIFDTETMHCKYANSEARKNLPGGSVTPVDALLSDIDPLFQSETFTEALARLLESDAEIHRFEIFRGARKHEAQLKLLARRAGHQDALLIMSDVSHREEAERIKSEFISSVSHELRSPMTSIKGALGLILAGSGGEIPERARRILGIAHRNADRLILIINDLLDIEKIAAGKMSFDIGHHDLACIVDEAIQASETYARGFEVTLLREGLDHAPVLVDFDRTLQLVTNLLSNATKVSDPNSRVIARVLQDGDTVTLEVQDFGCGIPDDLQATVFEKFAAKQVSRNPAAAGTGLGLAIVKAIAEQQGCSIDFTTQQNVGTTFRVRFPRPDANQGAQDICMSEQSA